MLVFDPLLQQAWQQRRTAGGKELWGLASALAFLDNVKAISSKTEFEGVPMNASEIGETIDSLNGLAEKEFTVFLNRCEERFGTEKWKGPDIDIGSEFSLQATRRGHQCKKKKKTDDRLKKKDVRVKKKDTQIKEENVQVKEEYFDDESYVIVDAE
ncbi:hypothetical protein ABW20_dc0101053 [Dactylellina cionopaga]|nr:hypothetical protein ABW20_dc0101053 [Dactylellina cionopaga]